jgi:hypothetical protein
MEKTDMRKGFDQLCVIITNEPGHQAIGGDTTGRIIIKSKVSQTSIYSSEQLSLYIV